MVTDGGGCRSWLVGGVEGGGSGFGYTKQLVIITKVSKSGAVQLSVINFKESIKSFDEENKKTTFEENGVSRSEMGANELIVRVRELEEMRNK